MIIILKLCTIGLYGVLLISKKSVFKKVTDYFLFKNQSFNDYVLNFSGKLFKSLSAKVKQVLSTNSVYPI